MIVRKSSNDICATCYKYHMWQKGGGMLCRGIEGEEEKEEDGDLEYKDNYDHGDDWDTEELVIDSDDDDDDNNNNNNNNNMEEDADGYTASERAYMDAISILKDDIDMVEEEQQQQQQEVEKEERYYLREEQALGNVVVINKL